MRGSPVAVILSALHLHKHVSKATAAFSGHYNLYATVHYRLLPVSRFLPADSSVRTLSSPSSLGIGPALPPAPRRR